MFTCCCHRTRLLRWLKNDRVPVQATNAEAGGEEGGAQEVSWWCLYIDVALLADMKFGRLFTSYCYIVVIGLMFQFEQGAQFGTLPKHRKDTKVA